MLIIKTRKNVIQDKNKLWKAEKIERFKINFSKFETKQKMQSYLISKEMDDLLFLDVINEDFQEQSKLISILISSLIQQQSPLLTIYEEKKKLLLDTLNSQKSNEKNLFRGKLVISIYLLEL